MFTSDDISVLLKSFPSDHVLLSSSEEKSCLIPSLSNDGFVKSSVVERGFLSSIRYGSERLHIASFAAEFNVTEGNVSNLVSQFRGSLIYSRDRQTVLPQCECKSLAETLWSQMNTELVSISEFTKAQDLAIEGIEALLQGRYDEGSGIPQEQVYRYTSPEGKNFISSQNYAQLVKEELRERMIDAQRAARTTLVHTHHLSGKPPASFIEHLAQVEIKDDGSKVAGTVRDHHGAILFSPITYLVRSMEEIIESVKHGQLPGFSLRQLTDEFGEMFAGPEDAKRMLQDRLGDDVLFYGDFAISRQFLDKLFNEKSHEVIGTGFTSVDTEELGFSFPSELQPVIAELVREHLLKKLGSPSDDFEIESLGNFIIRSDWRTSVTASINQFARVKAQNAWESSTIDDDIQFQPFSWADPSLSNLPTKPPPELQDLLLKNGLEQAAKSSFAQAITELSEQSIAQFRTCWRDKVITKLQLYRLGLESITEDEKLRAQLSQLLATYIVSDLVPDTLARAETRKLLRARTLKRSAEKLKSSLAQLSSPPTSSDAPAAALALALTDVLTCLDKFSTKHNIPTSLDDEALEGKKRSHVGELVKGMQKDKDAARLFLTLTIALLAKRRAGVIYATGKFAPKLVRLLKDEGETLFARLEELKEAVKRGAVTEKEREEMRQMALASVQ